MMPDEPNFAAFPRFVLTTLPTPIERALRLEDLLRAEGADPPRIYIKRDDMLGLALGGNKIRSLEFSIGAALAAGATDVVTVGRAQSNHCRLTAAACAKAGLRVHLVMSGDRPPRSTGNLLLSELFGASVTFTGSDDRVVRQGAVSSIADEIRRAGGQPYVIPVGGSDAHGAIGHAAAALEVVSQLRELGETPEAIVLATATGGTQAGMLAGLRRAGSDLEVRAFSVHKRAEESAAEVHALACTVAELIGAPAIDPGSVRVDDSQLGDGYGIPTAASQAAIELLARCEGLLLDPAYTAKAFAGLLADVRAGRWPVSQCVVFIHTGGTPALFAS
jgi:1-aminocyclopropane-1-carboxylate deaminase/D-cysteine desulfhydrase-like pyridoxal-dependent ACC family enzyme